MHLTLTTTCAALLLTAAVKAGAAEAATPDPASLDSVERASRHAIEYDKPAITFMEGGVLGNGGLGAVVCTRPDAVMIRLSHNDVWDIRLEEIPMEKLGTFDQVWGWVKSQDPADKKRYDDYVQMTQEPYKKPYPRPWPCGTLLLGFDRRRAELLGHRVRLEDGVCEVRFLVDGHEEKLEVFPEMGRDRLWLRMIDGAGQTIPAPFDRMLLIPEGGMPVTETRTTDTLAFRQVLATLTPDPQKDRALRVTARVAGQLRPAARNVDPNLTAPGPFTACVELEQKLAASLPEGAADLSAPTGEAFAAAAQTTRASWHDYWNRSGVVLADPALERLWYRNLYFLNCAARPGTTCPGLWANWSWGKVGTEWHGDYHTNYNIQQPFWVTFSSNHVAQHEPYVEMVKSLLPVSRRWAKEFYGLPGAFFPHSSYPLDMTVPPYPSPGLSMEVCETPWTVQSLWWHYAYTMDKTFLRERAFEPIKAAVQFLNGYMRRPEAHGPASPFKDDKFHIYPTMAPEIWGLVPDPNVSADCLVDLTLTRFVFKAYLDACAALGMAEPEAPLMKEVGEILAHYPDYATTDSARGRVFIDVKSAPAEAIYNVPNPLMAIFPGEEIGLDSPKEVFDVAANTLRNHRNEGGNELVFNNLQAARLGLLDLEKFKRQVNYCALPNGTCADMILQVGGRYPEGMPFEWMGPMGIWFENFSLPVVVNECLMQGYNGTIRLFPNWPKEKDARFRTLRAVGAFLVSAELAGGEVRWVEVTAEAGGRLRLLNPWPGPVSVQRPDGSSSAAGVTLEFETKPGETLVLRPAPAAPAGPAK